MGTEIKEGTLGGYRQYWLDVARTIAIITVTFNHSISRSFMTHEGTQSEFLTMTFLGSFMKSLIYVSSRLGVPLFLMISGALLLKRNYEDRQVVKRFLTHNWLQLLRTTVIWLIIGFWFMQLFEGTSLIAEGKLTVIFRFITTVAFINSYSVGPMWYMYMILAVYLMIPVISVGLKKLGDAYFYLPYGIVLISSMIFPNLNVPFSIFGFEKSLNLALSETDIFSIYFLYIIAGYWISEGKLSKINGKVIIALFFISFIGTVAFQLWIYSTPSDYYVRYADTGILLSSLFLFECIRRYQGKTKCKHAAFKNISEISLAIYFMHILIVIYTDSLLPDMNGFYRFLLLEISSFVGSYLIIMVTKKIYIFRHYLYLIEK